MSRCLQNKMLVNSDFSRRVEVTSEEYRWVASPQRGVERVMLDRIGGEQARATSIVRYAQDSKFPPHRHSGGEEILVLSGVFTEDEQHYPAGWYLRSPPGSAHRPSSDEGAVIFVKLCQMSLSERKFVRIDTRDPTRWTHRGKRHVCPLFDDGVEQVTLQRIEACEQILEESVRGAELLVLDGELRDGEHSYASGSWIRLPPGDMPAMVAGHAGVTIYLKTGHLAD